MVLRQNVSYDVYGTFCMESEGQTQQLTQTSHATQTWQEELFYSGQTLPRTRSVSLEETCLLLIHCKSESG